MLKLTKHTQNRGRIKGGAATLPTSEKTAKKTTEDPI